MNEVEAIRTAWGYGVLEAIQYISDMEDQYPWPVRTELKEFMRQGARMFAEVK